MKSYILLYDCNIYKLCDSHSFYAMLYEKTRATRECRKIFIYEDSFKMYFIEEMIYIYIPLTHIMHIKMLIFINLIL